jgi:hypothetical protein
MLKSAQSIGTSGCTGEMAKIFFLPIAMKLASIVEIAMLIIYHQGTEKILTER